MCESVATYLKVNKTIWQIPEGCPIGSFSVVRAHVTSPLLQLHGDCKSYQEV